MCGIQGSVFRRKIRNAFFERFYRVDKSHSREIGGTGLGLSIVKHGVKTLNGRLWLNSEPGQGTEIIMEFPKHHMEKEAAE